MRANRGKLFYLYVSIHLMTIQGWGGGGHISYLRVSIDFILRVLIVAFLPSPFTVIKWKKICGGVYVGVYTA